MPRAPAARQRSLSCKRVFGRVEAAERHEPSVRLSRPFEDAVVGHAIGGVSVRVVQGEHAGARGAGVIEL